MQDSAPGRCDAVVNPILREWGNYFRHCTSARRQFAILDYYGEARIWRRLIKRHQSLARKRTRLVRVPSLVRPTCKVWREDQVEHFLLATLPVERFRRGWMRTRACINVS